MFCLFFFEGKVGLADCFVLFVEQLNLSLQFLHKFLIIHQHFSLNLSVPHLLRQCGRVAGHNSSGEVFPVLPLHLLQFPIYKKWVFLLESYVKLAGGLSFL